MKIIDNTLLDSVTKQAEENPRRRMNYNFHESLDAPINRLLNALMTDTYLPPHKHSRPDKEEIFFVLRGSVLLLLFDDNGNVTFSKEINPQKGVYGMEFDSTIWHSLIVIEPNTVVYEVKEGPYIPLRPEDIASWAPPASDKEKAKEYNEQLLNQYYKQS